MRASVLDTNLPKDTVRLLTLEDAGRATQAQILAILVKGRYPTPLLTVAVQKVRILLKRLHLDEKFLGETVERAAAATFGCRRRRSPIFSWLLMRTWNSSWPTAHRMQKDAPLAATRSRSTARRTASSAPSPAPPSRERMGRGSAPMRALVSGWGCLALVGRTPALSLDPSSSSCTPRPGRRQHIPQQTVCVLHWPPQRQRSITWVTCGARGTHMTAKSSQHQALRPKSSILSFVVEHKRRHSLLVALSDLIVLSLSLSFLSGSLA